MNIQHVATVAALTTLGPLLSNAVDAETRVADLRCEYAVDPLGIDVPAPRFSWNIKADRRGARQTAFQIVAASDKERLVREPELWDTGKTVSDETHLIAYAGAALRSSQQVFWRVRAWDERDEPSEWSQPATFTTGVLSPDEWTAKWIVAPWQTESVLMRKVVRS